VDVDNPPVIMNTKGMWLDVPAKAVEILETNGYHVAASIHAAEHAVLSLLPNVVVTSPGDVRTECKAPQKEYAKVYP
jgi:DEAD/DEAH box helicase domain-containing protein